MIEEKIGKKFYSPYFKQMIEVVEYVDDNNWTFKLENGEVYTAQTPLSYFEGHDFTRDNPKRAVKQDMSKGQFVDCTDKTNDKIEEREKIMQIVINHWFDDNSIQLEEIADEILTLIQAERKEAVEGFVKYIYSRPSNEWIFPSNMFYEYLKESEGK